MVEPALGSPELEELDALEELNALDVLDVLETPEVFAVGSPELSVIAEVPDMPGPVATDPPLCSVGPGVSL